MAKRSDWIGEEIRALAWLLLAVGAIGIYVDINDGTRLFSERGSYGGVLEHRFQKDNAVGATANAVEWIAKQTAPSLIGNAIWLGLAVLALGLLRRIRIATERLADELAPLPVAQLVAEEKPSLARRVGEAVGNAMVSVVGATVSIVAPKVSIGSEQPAEVPTRVGANKKKKLPPTPPAAK